MDCFGLFPCLSFEQRCMNQAVYFCTGELQPALYAHYGLAMERRSAFHGAMVPRKW